MEFQTSKSFFKSTAPVIKKSPRTSLMEIILLVVVIVLFYWFIAKPKQAEVASLDSKYSEVKAEAESVKNQVEQLKGLVQQLKSHSKDIMLLDEALPLDGKITRLNLLMNSLAASSGVTLGDLSLSSRGDYISAGNTAIINNPFAAKRSLQKTTVNLNLFGNFSQIQGFLRKLENNGRILNLTSVEIEGSQDDKLNLRLSLETYYYE